VIALMSQLFALGSQATISGMRSPVVVLLICLTGCRLSAEEQWQPLHVVAPAQYPLLAAYAGVQGTVEVRCSLADNGAVLKAEAIAGPPLLRKAAEENAKQWQFRRTEWRGDSLQQVFIALCF
jgi:hypothetical protein